jgi:hypothetical protein
MNTMFGDDQGSWKRDNDQTKASIEAALHIFRITVIPMQSVANRCIPTFTGDSERLEVRVADRKNEIWSMVGLPSNRALPMLTLLQYPVKHNA